MGKHGFSFKGTWRGTEKNIGTFAKNLKLVGYDLPKEIIHRAVSPSYTHKKIMGKNFGKKNK